MWKATTQLTFAIPETNRIHMLQSVGSKTLGEARLAVVLISSAISDEFAAEAAELSR